MPQIDWNRIRPLIGQLFELPAEEHPEFLQRACGGDLELAGTVQRLFEDERRDAGFLETPIYPRWTQADADLATGLHVGSWQLVTRLAEGGMGEVWFAERPELGQQAAIKFIRAGHTSNEILGRFHLERRVLASLQHPNIARLVDGGALADGRPWFAMEFVEGRRLDRACRERKLSIDERLGLFLPILDAVEAAHRLLVVHRDLKPSNVVVQEDGTPKLLDFGIAKVLGNDEPGENLTRSDLRPMTPRYASPEQIEGGTVSTASDVYSLGVLLFELLTAASPYGETTSSVKLLTRVCEDDPRRPSSAIAGLDDETLVSFGEDGDRSRLTRKLRGELDWIVLRALRKEPTRRYASAERFGDDLRRYLAGEAVAAGPDSTRYRLAKLFRRRRVPILAAGLALVALIGATIVSTVAARRASSAAREERVALAAAADALSFLTHIVLAPTPDQGSGRETRVVDALMAARTSIESIESPLARWAAHDRVASALAQLGETEGAIHHYRAAIGVAEALGERGLPLAQAYLGLAGALELVGRDDETIPLLERGLALLDGPRNERLDSIVRVDSPARLRAKLLNLLASAYEEAGQHERALELFQSAQQALDANTTVGEMDVILRYNIAGTLLSLGHIEGSVRAAEATLEDVERASELSAHVHVGLLTGIGHFRCLVGNAHGAEPLARRAVTLARTSFEPQHPGLWNAELGLARALVELGQYAEALDLLQALRERPGADGTDQELQHARLLARALAQAGDTTAALQELDRILPTAERFWVDQPAELGLTLLAQAECLWSTSELEAARSAENRALTALVAFGGPDNVFVELARKRLAQVRPGD